MHQTGSHPPAGLDHLFFFFFFYVFDVKHSSALRFFSILSFTVLSIKIKLTLHFVSFSMTIAIPNHCHPSIPCSSSLHRPSSAFACPIHAAHALLQLLLPGSPGSYFYFPLIKLLFTWSSPTLGKILLL